MTNMHYFNPLRTQPFVVTLFMAIMAFKKLCKRMKLIRHHRSKGQLYGRRRTQLNQLMAKSQHMIRGVEKGQSVLKPNQMKANEILHEEMPMPSSAVTQSRPSTALRSRKKPEDIHREVSRQLSIFARSHHQDRAAELGERLDELAEAEVRALHQPSRPSSPSKTQAEGPANSLEPISSAFNSLLKHNNYFQQFSAQPSDDPEDETNPTTKIGEYLEGTVLYYGATISLQARHGGFLSYASQQLKASAHKITTHSRFVVKKSDDFTEAGAICYGDPLWLQAGTSNVLGANYGSLVDQKRIIQPALVSCKRQNMFKANQYGRWIILNRENPMGTLGKTVCHLDKIILEQEWYFLASSSPYESSMFKSLNNSDEAMTTKTDPFHPNDDCIWKVHLVDLPIDDKLEDRQRQKILQDAKEQIDQSAIRRYQKGETLLKPLTDTLPNHLQDDVFVRESLHHKLSAQAEQSHFLDLFRKLSAQGFMSRQSSPEFLQRIYGNNSRIATLRRQSLQLALTERSSSGLAAESASLLSFEDADRQGGTFLTLQIGDDDHADRSIDSDDRAKSHRFEPSASLQALDNEYWNQAQGLLVDSRAWAEVRTRMEDFENKDTDKKFLAAKVLQRSVKRFVHKKFNFIRAMKAVDEKASNRLKQRDNQRRKLLMEHLTTQSLVKKEMAKAVAVESQPPAISRVPSTVINSLASARPVSTPNTHRMRSNSFVSISYPSTTMPALSPAAAPSRAPSINQNHAEVLAAVAQELIQAPISASQKILLTRTRSMSAVINEPEIVLENNSYCGDNNSIPLEDDSPIDRRVIRSRSASMVPSSAPMAILQRPTTSPSSPHNPIHARNKNESALLKQKSELIRTMSRPEGLPKDVFDDMKQQTNPGVGLKFLRAMSSNGELFRDVRVTKKSSMTKNHSTSSVQPKKKKERAWNPSYSR